jgi:hypothetical protein
LEVGKDGRDNPRQTPHLLPFSQATATVEKGSDLWEVKKVIEFDDIMDIIANGKCEQDVQTTMEMYPAGYKGSGDPGTTEIN